MYFRMSRGLVSASVPQRGGNKITNKMFKKSSSTENCFQSFRSESLESTTGINYLSNNQLVLNWICSSLKTFSNSKEPRNNKVFRHSLRREHTSLAEAEV